MEYSYDDIDKVLNFKTWNNKKKIDELFRIDSYMYTNLGVDSNDKERARVERKSKAIYKEISKLDSYIGSELLRSIM
jgi:hypothetical protein